VSLIDGATFRKDSQCRVNSVGFPIRAGRARPGLRATVSTSRGGPTRAAHLRHRRARSLSEHREGIGADEPLDHDQEAPRTFLGELSVTTGANCIASFTTSFPVLINPSHVVTATATDGAVGTSELSPARGLTPTRCAPRPPVQVTTARDGPGRLRARVAAVESPVTPGNRLRELQVSATTNARLDVVGRPGDLTGGAIVPLPGRPGAIELVVRRLTPGQPATAQLVAVDDCGPWRTLVGGGPNAF